MRFAKKSLIVFFLLLLSVVALLWYHQVDTGLTDRDKIFISQIMRDHNLATLPAHHTYQDEVVFIKAVQNAVLLTAPKNKGLPEGLPREPETLYKAKQGLCYDRSRVIEKILKANGFKTRHISVYSLDEQPSAIKALITKRNRSHALSEVLTGKGWMFVDSNDRLVGLDQSANPISMDMVEEKGFSNISWSDNNDRSFDGVYATKFIPIYGLYSRHGRFYKPFNLIPDVNWAELSCNFF